MSSPHRDVFVGLVRKHGWTRGAELGVDKGILFHKLLTEFPSLTLYGVDTCPVPARKAKCEAIAAGSGGRGVLFVMTTNEAAVLIGDGSLDFVFIDADHSERAVFDDIAFWMPKVRAGGWLGGHDYNSKFPGVLRAVDVSFGGDVQTYGGSIWGVWR